MSSPFVADRRNTRWLYGIIVAVVVVILMTLTAVYVLTEPSEKLADQPPPIAPLTTLTPSSTTVPPTTTLSPVVPEPSSPPQDSVAQGMPTSFSITCAGESLVSVSSLTTTVDRDVRVGNELRSVSSVMGDVVAVLSSPSRPWAVMPGSDSGGTTTIAGHADSPRRMAFNPIAEYNGDVGDCTAEMVLPGGELTYGPPEVFLRSKAWLSEAQKLSGEANTLLTATCFNDGQTIFWRFPLTSSRAY